jgi:hypothetical protein
MDSWGDDVDVLPVEGISLQRQMAKFIHIPSVFSHSHGKSPFLIGKPSINGPFSMAMLNI